MSRRVPEREQSEVGMGPLDRQALRGERTEECLRKYQCRRGWKTWNYDGRDVESVEGTPVHHPPEPVEDAQVRRKHDEDVRIVERPLRRPDFSRVQQLRWHLTQARNCGCDCGVFA